MKEVKAPNSEIGALLAATEKEDTAKECPGYLMHEEVIQGYRLSPQQKRLWLLQQESDSPAFRAQCAITIEGKLDAAALTAALDELVKRHDILRTTFECLYGMTIPVQVVADARPQSGIEYDLRGLAQQEQAERIQQTMREVLHRAFDYGREPVLRRLLLRLSEDKHILVITLPALCADSIGLSNIMREIGDCYEAIVIGEKSAHEPMQYLIASEWQNNLFDSEDFELGKTFWQRQDLSSPGALRLPFGREPEKAGKFQPECVSAAIDSAAATKIAETAQQYGVSVSVFLLACWYVLVGRLTGQSEVTIGVRYDGRVDDEMEQAVGLFAKHLPIQSRISEQIRFSQLLEQIDESAREAHGWQEWFIWDHLTGGRADTCATTFLPVSFGYEEEPASYSSRGVTFSICERYVCIDRFELMLNCARGSEGMMAHLFYDTGVYGGRDAERTLRQYERLVWSAAQNAEARVDELDILTREDRRQLLTEFNDTKNEYPQRNNIQELFEQQAELTPDAIAVVHGQESLTYAELNRRANQLANYLRRLGVGAEIRVALCLERGLEMVVSLLAVLKAGGAYVPLDPSYPLERMRHMLEDSQAAVVLTQKRLMGRLPEYQAKSIDVYSDRSNWADESASTPMTGMSEQNLAYIIYTSGSTGWPKGVGIEHAQLLNYVRAVGERLSLEPGWRMALVSTLAADLGHTVLYPSLCLGGVLHVVSEECGLDKRLWEEYQSQRQIDCLKITPTHVQALVNRRLGLPLKRLILGGEQCSREWVRLVREWSPDCEVVNHYGPTECTVGAITHLVQNEAKENVPIGKPLSNVRAYVLSGAGGLVPVGVPGELYIGGAGVGRGYVNNPETTARQFVPDEYGNQAGARVYRTGDLVRYRRDGNIEFMARIDYQVKIRGFRVELGEIEAVLAQHPGLLNAVVVAEGDDPATRRLVAYLVAKTESAPANNELRDYLAARLPEYMLPSAWVMLEFMPLTPNGKVDREALRAAEGSQVKGTTGFEPTQTPTEHLVAGVWSSLLALDQVSRHDNFFALGGHSLLATQVITRLRDCLQLELALGSLFEAPTVAGFAEKIDAAMRAAPMPGPPPLRPASPSETYPLSFGQLHMWLREQMMPEGSGSYIWGAWRQEEKDFNLAALEQGFSEIIRRHKALRTTFPSIKGECMQLIGEAEPICLPVADLSMLSEQEKGAELRRWNIASARRRFDLGAGPLIRVRLIKLGEGRQVLQYIMHHIIADARSVDVIGSELGKLYDSYTHGEASALEELELQYVDYAVWQRDYMKGLALQRRLEYWRQRLEGAPALLELQTDRTRSEIRTYRGGWQRLRLTSGVAQSLIALSKQEDVTLFMTMLAAYQILLYRQGGQQDISVGTPVTFRDRAEIEGLVGYFTNTVVLRVDLAANPSFREVLRRVREVTLGAYTHQELPFDVLVEQMGVGKGQAHAPLFQAWFNFLDHSTTDVSNFLSARSEESETNTHRFDLAMVVTHYAPGLDVSLGYNKDLFDSERIKAMLGQFERLVRQMIAEPDEQILDTVPLYESIRKVTQTA
jgi:amino acid adenylation domain-containing protein